MLLNPAERQALMGKSKTELVKLLEIQAERIEKLMNILEAQQGLELDKSIDESREITH